MDKSKDFVAYYDEQFAPHLSIEGYNRADGFRTMFKTLLRSGVSDFRILETGTTRKANHWSDGQSTVIFDHLAQMVGGTVLSVDISQDNCTVAQSLVSGRTRVICADSVTYLLSIPAEQKFDLVYLDSFDLDVNNPLPSAMHHMKELVAVWKNVRPGTILAVDDSPNPMSGKGMLVANFMKHIGVKPLHVGYQVAWQV